MRRRGSNLLELPVSHTPAPVPPIPVPERSTAWDSPTAPPDITGPHPPVAAAVTTSFPTTTAPPSTAWWRRNGTGLPALRAGSVLFFANVSNCWRPSTCVSFSSHRTRPRRPSAPVDAALPPWSALDLAGACYGTTLPWLRALGQPLDFVSVTYSEYQDSAQASSPSFADSSQAQARPPGRYRAATRTADHPSNTPGTRRSRIRWGRQPSRIEACRRCAPCYRCRGQPPAPDSPGAGSHRRGAFGPFNATAVRFSSASPRHTRLSVYARYRKIGTRRPGPNLSQPSPRPEPWSGCHQLTALDAGTGYVAQAALELRVTHCLRL